MTFVITAKFVINSIRSAQKSAECVFFSLTLPCYSLHTFWIFVRTALTRRFSQIHKTYDLLKNVQKYSLFMLWKVPFKFFYNSKFDFTEKSLVTSTVIITRVLCIRKNCSFTTITHGFIDRFYRKLDKAWHHPTVTWTINVYRYTAWSGCHFYKGDNIILTGDFLNGDFLQVTVFIRQ